MTPQVTDDAAAFVGSVWRRVYRGREFVYTVEGVGHGRGETRSSWPMLRIRMSTGNLSYAQPYWLLNNCRPVNGPAWFLHSGHCAACGQPGGYCLCPESRPCECAGLHQVGSGLEPDALDAFTDRPPAVISEDQESLFGGGDD